MSERKEQSWIKKLVGKSSAELSILLLIVLLFIFFSIATPNFLSKYNVINLFKQSAVTGIITIGLSFVLISGKIDLSCGAICGFSAMVVALLMSQYGMPP